MISAFGIDHGDDVSKSAPSAIRQMLARGEQPKTLYGQIRAIGMRSGNPAKWANGNILAVHNRSEIAGARSNLIRRMNNRPKGK